MTIYVLHQYYAAKPIAYIDDVGVLPNYQRQGIGKSLISYTCEYGKENGFEDAYVEAESEDIDAVNFYRNRNLPARWQQLISHIHFSRNI